MSDTNTDRLMAVRGIDQEEALRILGDPGLVRALTISGDILSHSQEVVRMPGVQSSMLGPWPGGCNPLTEVCPPVGSVASPLINAQLPGGIVTDWGPLIREVIDRVLGGSDPGSGLQPRFPNTTGPPGQYPVPIGPGTGVAGCVPCQRPKVGFITMPNGLPGCPTGYHPEKSGKPYCVRNRRMNSLNPRALSRATRRVGGFARAVKRARTLKKVCRSL